MKTTLRVLALGFGILSPLLCVGCKEDEASAEGFDLPHAGLLAEATPPPPTPLALPLAFPAVADQSSPSTHPAPAPPGANAKAGNTTTNTNANVEGAPFRGAAVAEPITPSPALAEVIKLAQAGVGEDVLMAFVTNSTAVYEIGSNEILYLHDLGLPAPVISALIQRAASPEAQSRSQVAGAVKPLPPGVALTTPATNVYPGKYVGQPPETASVNSPTPQENPSGPPPGPNVGPSPVPVEPPVAPQEPVTIDYFQTTLAPYGSWVDVPGYGSCWRPTVAVCNSAWRPYADHGRWLWTDSGWYWYSDYSWGWAPFHYGRWACPQGIGWVWTPDTYWGPSWVSWRYSSAYCGWAPLPPAAVWGGHGFYHNTLSVGVSFEFGLSDFNYVFLPFGRFCDRTPYHHYASSSHARAIYKDSTVINNYVVGNNNTIINQGVGFDRVAKVTRGDIRQVALKNGNAVRDLGPRREQLETDGKTLTVVRPTLVKSRIEAPLKPISATSGLKQNAQSGNPAKPGAGSAGGLAGANESSAPVKSPALGVRSVRPATGGADQAPFAVGAPGNSGIFKPRPNERNHDSVSRSTDTASLIGGGASTKPRAIIIKPSGNVPNQGNTVPGWMNAAPSAPANAAGARNNPQAKSVQAPPAVPGMKSPAVARNDAAAPTVYTRPGATRSSSYRAVESPQPRMNAPSVSPGPAPRVQSGQDSAMQSAPRSGGGRSAPASSSKSEGASRSSGDSRGGKR